MADDATTQKIAALLIGQQNPSVGDMWRFIDRNPEMAAANQGQYPGQPMGLPNTGMAEMMAASDPMGAYGLQRLIGSPLSPIARVNEGHGIMRKELERLWDKR